MYIHVCIYKGLCERLSGEIKHFYMTTHPRKQTYNRLKITVALKSTLVNQ